MLRLFRRTITRPGCYPKILGKWSSTKEPTYKSENFDGVCLKNEPIRQFLPDSDDICELEKSLKKLQGNFVEVPIVIGGKTFKSKSPQQQYMPHNRRKKVAEFYYADKAQILEAMMVAIDAQKKWDKTKFSERIRIFETAADLMSDKYRYDLLAATMLGQSKTVYQAEIDIAELTDFIRMHSGFLKQLLNRKLISLDEKVTINQLRYRGIEGFVAAISPFNFTAIAGNLAFCPALMGNGVVWKPSHNSILSNWLVFKIMQEAGLPHGVVNFVPADGPSFGSAITASEYLAGINFTGSVQAFNNLWTMVGANIETFRNYPRLSGECGGKNFHFVHPSAHLETVVAQTIRSAFEYSGQKCSACSRLYIPKTLWDFGVRDLMLEKTCKLKVGDVCEYDTFTSAVIDQTAFARIVKYINMAKSDDQCEFIVGGKFSNLKGFFVDPTIIEVKNPQSRLFKDEIFGPLLSVYVYEEKNMKEAMNHVVYGTKFGLTGSVFSEDRDFLKVALEKFKMAAGNFYINDKCTGAIVGQQPFGGGRISGTNDKAGGVHYVLRWGSPQAIKETFVPMTNVYYPYMGICENDY